MRPPKHNPTKPHCFLTQRASNPEASRTNVSEETQCTWQSWLACTAPGPPQESLVRDETRISLPAKPSLTRTTLGQLCGALWNSQSRAAGCDRAWARTQSLWMTEPFHLTNRLTHLTQFLCQHKVFLHHRLEELKSQTQMGVTVHPGRPSLSLLTSNLNSSINQGK